MIFLKVVPLTLSILLWHRKNIFHYICPFKVHEVLLLLIAIWTFEHILLKSGKLGIKYIKVISIET